jgi:tRNA pseudouridine55 synthase
MDGLLVIDKPAGPTSHDIVARMRRVLGESRIGHTGTLDPAASGVLPLVLGRATRLARFMSGSNKRYEAVVRFGQATDTYDAEGVPVGERSLAVPSRTQIESALETFRGTFKQQPPAFSAKKIAGRRSYESARAARLKPQPDPPDPPDLPGLPGPPGLPAPVSVTVHHLALVGLAGDCATLTLECSAGFYVRALAHELGAKLGCGAHLTALRRTASAGLTLADAIPLDAAERSRDDAIAAIVPIERMLQDLPSVVLGREDVERVTHGQDVAPAAITGAGRTGGDSVRLFDQAGQLVGIGEAAAAPGFLHPSIVLR